MKARAQRPVWWQSTFTGAVLLILLTVLAHLPTVRGGFLWDDSALVTDNPIVKAPDGLYRFWFTTEAPDYAEAHCDLGIALGLSGKRPEAIEHLQRAIQLKPDFTQAQNELARL